MFKAMGSLGCLRSSIVTSIFAVLDMTGYFASLQLLGAIYQFINAYSKACWHWESVTLIGHYGWDRDGHRAVFSQVCVWGDLCYYETLLPFLGIFLMLLVGSHTAFFRCILGCTAFLMLL